MSNSEDKEPFAGDIPASPADTAAVVSNHEGQDGMGARDMTVGRYEEIRRRLAERRGGREIARALGCARGTALKVRDGLSQSPESTQAHRRSVVDATAGVAHDRSRSGLGHPLKFFIWDEKAQHLTTDSNFWNQFNTGSLRHRARI